ncbi:hypothetical protein GGU11DRAFT_830463, partial [Lentinula aff. detonsa]
IKAIKSLTHNIEVEIPTPPSGLQRKTFKSKAIISNDLDKEGDDKSKEPTPRGVKQKQMIRMIAKGGNTSDLDSDYDPNLEQAKEQLPSPSDSSLPPFSLQNVTPSQCGDRLKHARWSGENTAQRSRGKWVKLDDEVYEGPAARVGERRFEGPGIAEQLAKIASQNGELVNIARRSLVLQERMLGPMVRRERRELEAIGGSEKDEDEDEDGEGEEDEEEAEKNNEKKRRDKIHEGKKCAE